MKRAPWIGVWISLWVGAVVALLSTAVVGQTPGGRTAPAAAIRSSEQARKTLDTYCVGCHNS
ncbi:MAG TPA: hypothetical protein VN759_07030, partial [Pseudolysinimonas sp.]|nr:hypothetical protein [Pseudolysinimonas sp.]